MRMHGTTLGWISTLLALIVATRGEAQPLRSAPLVELRGGAWFDGTRFVTGSRYMRAGSFVARNGETVDSIVQLSGRWVIPPFGDAHTHSPDGPWGFDGIRDTYLRAGVFYVQVLTNSRSGRRALTSKVNVPESVDAAFADGAVTSTGGHPQVLYESLGLYRRFWQVDSERVASARSLARDGDVYHRLDSLAQLPALVARLARDTVPLLKVMLLDSERWATLRGDSAHYGFYGISPTLLAPLTDAAHRLGRRVWVHIETPADLHRAALAGVDGLAHAPGYGAPGASDSVARTLIVPDSTLRALRGRRLLMTPTLGLAVAAAGNDTAKLRRLSTVMVRNVRAMRRMGVQVLAGSDTYSDADILRGDPAATATLLGFTPLQLLRMRSVDTPRAIFPDRRIGTLTPGAEASALVLTCNPLRDTRCLDAIALRLKQGQWLTVPPVAP